MKYWFRRWNVWLLAILVCVAVVACNSNLSQSGNSQSNSSQGVDNISSDCCVIQHDGGETEVCGQPQKVVALSPPLLDILLSLGVQPAGYAEVELLNQKVFDNPAQQIPFLGDRVTSQPVNLGSRDSPSLETLLTLNPDLILGEKFSVEANYNQFSAIAPTAYFETTGEEGWKPILQAIAAGLNRQDKAQQVLDAHNRHIEATRQKIAPLVAGQTIIVLGWQSIANQSFVLERGFVTNLLEDLGFQVIVASSDETALSMESVAGLDADHILIMPTGDNTIERAKQQWETHPILRSIPAVQAGNLYFMDYQLARIRGPIAAEIFIHEFTSLLTQTQT
ncbi:ABC transporter substrate-binding protein [Thermocoleostomius sinensis]|uniref:Iron-siderophore ABC transporter substrate-binding protein n=1 Tax=Thermocoleostomius sinensis A174 TaxID=2016057 RepID=A0A9E8ZB11_9CYAN|nr:iron-siderophore ABC transporter substrate-binding protein [Thermocoleostomius sinensis]WAL59541.1 iron-siderophore ABC transporter substrate-binding protein [Thermocoleostomius sinensis A174]